MSHEETAANISNFPKTRDWTVNMLRHVQGELKQRVKDLLAKGELRQGGARSQEPSAARLVAQACDEAAAVFDRYLQLFPEPESMEEQAESQEPPGPRLHPRHPDAQKGKRDVRG